MPTEKTEPWPEGYREPEFGTFAERVEVVERDEPEEERPPDFVAAGTEAPEKDVVRWVFEHLGDGELPKTGPTYGAMSMLLWARKEQNSFFTLWKSTILSKTELEAQNDEPRRRTNRDLRSRLQEIIEHE